MEFICGACLSHARGTKHLPQDLTKDVAAEIAGYISQLRRLQPPRAGIVASANLGKGLDHRIGDWTWSILKNLLIQFCIVF